jgi:hypothetical protein
MGFRKQWKLLSWINPSFRKTFLDSPSRSLAPLLIDPRVYLSISNFSNTSSDNFSSPRSSNGERQRIIMARYVDFWWMQLAWWRFLARFVHRA